MNKRVESDFIGDMEIEDSAYYGVQSVRAKNNFNITGNLLNDDFIKNLAILKMASAEVNKNIGNLDSKIADAIITACKEIISGKLHKEFIVDSVQGGAGTSMNMNANEVIANRAIEILGGKKGEYSICHPNDHVNKAQSTNDVIPSAGKLTCIDLINELIPAIKELIVSLQNKGKEFFDVVKMGRTQLQDAVPMNMGQEFIAYSKALERDIKRIESAREELYYLNMGGTAIGNCINAPEKYVEDIAKEIAKITGYPLKKCENLFDGTSNLDCFLNLSTALKICATNLSKMSNDLRLLSSGPRTGIGEINLPAKQNGSSIMPGKVNPVIPEVVSQVCFMVVGSDVTINMAVEAGQLELNAFEPVIFYRLFESLIAMKNAMDTLRINCIDGLKANRERCEKLVNCSAGVATALCPYIGYKKSADIAKESLKTGKSVKEIVSELNLFNEKELEEILDIRKMTGKN